MTPPQPRDVPKLQRRHGVEVAVERTYLGVGDAGWGEVGAAQACSMWPAADSPPLPCWLGLHEKRLREFVRHSLSLTFTYHFPQVDK